MRLISLFSIVVLLFIGCKKKDKDEPEVVSENLKNGIAVLCEGLFQQNNSSVSWVDLANGQVTQNLFVQKANRSLGDTGNDILKYGGKVYIAVNVSSTIEILEAGTFKPLKQINMEDAGIAKQPRFFVAQGPRVFVTCYDGYVDVIDTTSLSVVQRIPVGPNPEGMAIANNKLYVANSGGLNFPQMDSTVSVIDLGSLSELSRITVGINPGDVEVAGNGDIYVISRGDYSSIPSHMFRIDSQTDVVEQEFTFEASGITPFSGNYFLISHVDFTGSSNLIGLFNTATLQMENSNFLDLSNVETAYDVSFDPVKNRIYVLDALNFTTTGYVHQYNSSGGFVQKYHVGLNPTAIVTYE